MKNKKLHSQGHARDRQNNAPDITAIHPPKIASQSEASIACNPIPKPTSPQRKPLPRRANITKKSGNMP
ncbi:MAG: hypothetical protein P8R31_08595 [Mariniblastus sp.]|nr:hypothetical protein [Mariniblastus sp.]